jgi:hypothetical protein
MVFHDPTINTMSHENISMMMVLMAVASIESTFLIPIFARIAVAPANSAEPKARSIHIIPDPLSLKYRKT